ncbi:MAG TPA: hypothetical protein VMS56_05445 [Thermoanaerobaculia bacterium]|nr:hypothetical protein [Thermoanaerobaculia bacterium]
MKLHPPVRVRELTGVGVETVPSPASGTLQHRGLCPCCASGTSSYEILADGGWFFCHECERRWDLVGWYAWRDGGGTHEARTRARRAITIRRL